MILSGLLCSPHLALIIPCSELLKLGTSLDSDPPLPTEASPSFLTVIASLHNLPLQELDFQAALEGGGSSQQEVRHQETWFGYYDWLNRWPRTSISSLTKYGEEHLPQKVVVRMK